MNVRIVDDYFSLPTEEKTTFQTLIDNIPKHAIPTAITLGIGSISEFYPFLDGLKNFSSSEKIAGLFKNSTGITWIISSTYLLLSTPYNWKYTQEGLEALFTNAMPKEWDALSYKSKTLVILLAGLGNFFAITSDTVGTAYFLKQLGWSTSASYVLGALSSLATIPTESLESFRILCKKIAGLDTETVEEHSQSLFKQLGNDVVDLLKFKLKTLSALEDGIEGYIYFAAMFSIVCPTTQWIIFTLSAINALTDFCFNGKNSSAAIDQFIEKLSQGIPSFKEMLIFMITLIPAVIAGDVQRNLILSLLNDPDAPMPFGNIPSVLKHAFSWLAAGQQTINFISALNPRAKALEDTPKDTTYYQDEEFTAKLTSPLVIKENYFLQENSLFRQKPPKNNLSSPLQKIALVQKKSA